MSDAAVHYFIPNHPQLARTLRGKLENARNLAASQVADGHAMDWGDYKWRVGVIEGFNRAIELCREAEKQLGD
jgi:hypothetical protein